MKRRAFCKKLAAICLVGLLFAAPLALLLNGGFRALSQSSNPDPFDRVERTLARRLPGMNRLRRLRVSLSYAGGSKEQNGVFISSDGALMLDVQPADQKLATDNMLAMIDFAEEHQRPTYAMLIPTACAILQSKVPYAEVAPLYDQRQLIDDVYRRMAGRVTAIDVYPTLFNHQDDYIYYNTENNLTGLGGYYVYSTAAKRLGQVRVRGLEEFEVKHLDHAYYGDLYQLSPYREVKPDRVSAYSFSKFWRTYTVTKLDADGSSRRYYTLYPEYRAQLGGTMEVLLGGRAPITDIEIGSSDSANNYNQRLLVFGDRSVLSYLPFLMVTYERVTVVDTSLATPELLAQVDVSQYNQVLFSYLVDSFAGADQLSMLERLPKPDGGDSP